MLDEKKFKQVLVNLIGNAVKYTERGEVEVIVESTEKDSKIRIKDSGIGMNEQEREKLFTKFYRVQNDKTNKITGTGLGLWITKEIVEAMGGKIMVDSIKDVGSEFSITFPKA
jgi:signal transduction histidine kinase